jgi:hypothetical protein
MRWRGNPSTALTKANENQFLAVVADTSVANSDPETTPVTTTTTAGLIPLGEYQTYVDTDRVLIESGLAVLQASAAYAAAQNGMGVATDTTAGVVVATAKAADALTAGTIVGGGTRTVGAATVNVVYVRGLPHQ